LKGRTGGAELVKTVNTSIILEIIRKKGEISRAKIARISKLNPSTVSKITRELIKIGLLKEVGTGISQLGRKPIQLSLNPDIPSVIGVEVTEDRIVALMTNIDAKVIARIRTSIESNDDGKAVLKKAIRIIHELIEKGRRNKKRIVGIGMGITGLVDPVRGIALFSPNIGWRDVPVKQLIKKEFKINTFIDNDVKVMALGEYRFGSVKGVQSLVSINIGEGLGSGIIIDGKIYRGANWIAGEIGHTVVGVNGPKCKCGNRGCLETFAGGRAMVHNAKKAIKEGTKTFITTLANKGLDQITPKLIFEAAKQEDKLAKGLVEKAGRYLGIAIANTINSFDPEVVILGGEIAQLDNFHLMLEPAKKTAASHVFGEKARKTKILTTKLGDDSPAIGAVTLALEKLFNPLGL